MADSRIAKILELITQLAGGQLEARATPSTKMDELDAIITGLNMLAEEFSERHVAKEEAAQRLVEITDAVCAFATQAFDARAPLTDSLDDFDGLAAGVNMLGEELQHSVVSKDYIESVFGSMTDAMLVVGPDDRVETVNEATLGLLGYREEEVIGQSLDFVFARDENAFRVDDLPALREQGRISDRAAVLRASGGQEIPMSLNGAAVSVGGEPTGRIVLVARDMREARALAVEAARVAAERQRADEIALERERLATTLRSIGDGVIVTDVKGQVELLNGIAEEMTGWTTEDARGREINEVFRIVNQSTRQPVTNPVNEVLRTGRSQTLANDTSLLARNGEERVIADSAAPIRSGQGALTGAVLVFRDVTAKERQARELADAYRELESNQARLLQAGKMTAVGEMASGVAHELNNPLTGVVLRAGFLRDDLAGHPALKESLQDLEVLVAGAEKCKHIVDRLLRFSRRETRERTLLDLNALVESVLALVGSQLQQRDTHVEVKLSGSLPVLGNANDLEQVLANLLLNASEAMDKGRTVLIFGSAVDQGVDQPATVRLHVKNPGEVISEENLSRIFDPFFTTKSRSGGTGLGLSVSHEIMQSHGGALRVASSTDTGTCFTMELPRASPAEREASAAQQEGLERIAKTPSGDPPPKQAVLVVDDDPFALSSMANGLRRKGFEVLAAASGDEALTLLKETTVGVLLTDRLMPGMDGLQLIEKARSVAPSIVSLLISGNLPAADVARAKELGALEVLSKPCTLGVLVESVSSACGEWSRLAALEERAV